MVDGSIAGAGAETALQHAGKISARLFIEGGGRHDHAGGAEPALEGLRVQKGLLYGMQLAVPRQALDGGDGASLCTIGGHQAAMEWHAVDINGAGAAIALVAAFLDAEPAMLAQESAQTLARCRLRRELLAVNGQVHRAASSARICSAE